MDSPHRNKVEDSTINELPSLLEMHNKIWNSATDLCDPESTDIIPTTPTSVL